MFTPGYKLEFGHYTILKEIGSGGMGIVYHCRDEFLQREIAVKMMLPELLIDEDTIELFRQEARLAAQLEHPNIVTIHSIGVENRQGASHHYIAMEYLPGGNLRDRISQEPVSIEQALDWMQQLASALGYAHKKGVFHQDIKPDNIFITQDGNVKLGDFGLALLCSPQEDEKGPQTKGTPAYMSPELCQGAAQDQRSDIYSLGAVFYELLTGERPFKAEGMVEMALKHTSAPLPSAAEFRKDVPAELDATIKKMMSKKPEDRPQTLAELAPALEKMLLEAKVARLHISMPKAPETKSHPRAALGKAVDFNLSNLNKTPEPADRATALALKTTILQHPLPDPAKQKELEPIWIFRSGGPIGWAATPVINHNLKQIYVPSADGVLYALDLNSGDCLWYFNSGTPLLAGPHFMENDIYCPGSDGNLYCLSAVDGSKRWTCPGDSPIVAVPTAAADSLLVTDMNGNLRAVSRSDGSVKWTYKCSKAIVSKAEVSDSTAYVVSKDMGLHAVDVNNGWRRWMIKANDAILTNVLVSSDSLNCASIRGEILSLDLESGRTRWVHHADGALLGRGSLDLSSVNFCSKDGVIHCLDKFKGHLIWSKIAYGPVISGLTGSGGAVYVSSSNGYLHSLNSKTGDLNWFIKFPGQLESTPLVTSRVIYQGSLNGELYALPAPARAKPSAH